MHRRREFLSTASKHTLAASFAIASFAEPFVSQVAAEESKGLAKDEWLDEWIRRRRELGGPLRVQKFVERMYILLVDINWSPNQNDPEQRRFPRVTAPKGFVTDFASIPSVFWPLLPPDGPYAFPAIIHDYMYWYQTYPKAVADQVFKYGMQDLDIAPATIDTIYSAVSLGGQAAWNENASLKAKGEKRCLKKFPENPTVRWADWKTRTDVWCE